MNESSFFPLRILSLFTFNAFFDNFIRIQIGVKELFP